MYTIHRRGRGSNGSARVWLSRVAHLERDEMGLVVEERFPPPLRSSTRASGSISIAGGPAGSGERRKLSPPCGKSKEEGRSQDSVRHALDSRDSIQPQGLGLAQDAAHLEMLGVGRCGGELLPQPLDLVLLPLPPRCGSVAKQHHQSF